VFGDEFTIGPAEPNVGFRPAKPAGPWIGGYPVVRWTCRLQPPVDRGSDPSAWSATRAPNHTRRTRRRRFSDCAGGRAKPTGIRLSVNVVNDSGGL